MAMFVLGTVFGIVFTLFCFKLEITYGKVEIIRKKKDKEDNKNDK